MIFKVKVGSHDVEVTAEPLQNSAVRFTARSGGHERTGVMSINPGNYHDYTQEQLQKDMDDFAGTLAKEVAGHAQHSKLIARLFPQS